MLTSSSWLCVSDPVDLLRPPRVHPNQNHTGQSKQANGVSLLSPSLFCLGFLDIIGAYLPSRFFFFSRAQRGRDCTLEFRAPCAPYCSSHILSVQLLHRNRKGVKRKWSGASGRVGWRTVQWLVQRSYLCTDVHLSSTPPACSNDVVWQSSLMAINNSTQAAVGRFQVNSFFLSELGRGGKWLTAQWRCCIIRPSEEATIVGSNSREKKEKVSLGKYQLPAQDFRV